MRHRTQPVPVSNPEARKGASEVTCWVTPIKLAKPALVSRGQQKIRARRRHRHGLNQSPSTNLSGFGLSKMTGALDEIDHVCGRMDRERMWGKARPWRDIRCHFASRFELVVRCVGKKRNYQIFQSDDTDPQCHQIGIGQIGNCNSLGIEGQVRGGPAGTRAAFIVPSR
jgi:hypothetical protein